MSAFEAQAFNVGPRYPTELYDDLSMISCKILNESTIVMTWHQKMEIERDFDMWLKLTVSVIPQYEVAR